jgi:DNA-binding transcriptional LysR family regulator
MNATKMNLTDLQTFLQVADLGSFSAAAKALGVPKSTISRRVTRLEDELGVSLLNRKARSIEVTELGRQLEARCSPAMQEISDFEDELEQRAGKPSGWLRITAPHDIGTSAPVMRHFTAFREEYPDVRLELDLESRFVDLIQEGFDIAIRPASQHHQMSDGLMQKSIGSLCAAMYASREYVEAHGAPKHPDELADRSCLTLTNSFARESWPLLPPGEDERRSFPINATLRTNDFSPLLPATLAGAGIAFLPRLIAQSHVESGALVPVLEEWAAAEAKLTLVWPASRHLSPRVRAFIDFFDLERGHDGNCKT